MHDERKHGFQIGIEPTKQSGVCPRAFYVVIEPSKHQLFLSSRVALVVAAPESDAIIQALRKKLFKKAIYCTRLFRIEKYAIN